MKKNILFLAIPTLALSCGSVFAAKVIDLSQQPASLLNSFMPTSVRGLTASTTNDQVKEISRDVGFNQTMHIRMQQMYMGYPVYGADAILHVPHTSATTTPLASFAKMATNNKSTMNGSFYEDLGADLKNTPSYVFTSEQAQKAVDEVTRLALSHYGAGYLQRSMKNQMMVYVDKNNKAHYVFQISLFLEPTANKRPVEPIYIIDAISFQVYSQWNNLKSVAVEGGGQGGNKKHMIPYDGEGTKKLVLDREESTKICLLKNVNASVYDFTRMIGGYRKVVKNLKIDSNIERFNCLAQDATHHNLYWDGALDQVNSGFSPANDAIYAGNIIQDMYKTLYNVPMLSNPDKSPMLLKMVINAGDPSLEEASTSVNGVVMTYNRFANAFWADEYGAIFLGDGDNDLYPLTSLGVVAHEVSHGFTSQHSNLDYTEQSGSMNEAFSDMAAQTAEYFAYGKSSWQIGGEIMKQEGDVSLRYMDMPSKNCQGRKAGDACSIDTASQYAYLTQMSYQYTRDEDERQSYMVHFGSGVYNRLFYELATAPKWDATIAFGVMIDANKNYWTTTADFSHGACGIISAAKDRQYDLAAVYKAIDTVGIDRTMC